MSDNQLSRIIAANIHQLSEQEFSILYQALIKENEERGDIISRVKEIYSSRYGSKLHAVAFYKRMTGLGLKESKENVESIINNE